MSWHTLPLLAVLTILSNASYIHIYYRKEVLVHALCTIFILNMYTHLKKTYKNIKSSSCTFRNKITYAFIFKLYKKSYLNAVRIESYL